MRPGQFEDHVKPVPQGLVIETNLVDEGVIRTIQCLLDRFGDFHQPAARAALSAEVCNRLPQWAQCARMVLQRLAAPPYFCTLKFFPWVDAAPSRYHATITALVSLLGEVSDDNAYNSHGAFSDDVRPTDPNSTDVTYSFDCEVHADESSKPRPEDIVTLWCVRPARVGGASMIWSVPEILETLRAMPHGKTFEHTLRQNHFPFGGRLRKPPRVLLAPIVFGRAGIRFRLGAIHDAFEVMGRVPRAAESSAIEALLDAIRETPAYAFTLARGEVSCAMNRMTLHSRAFFSDQDRWLIRSRLNNDALSNSDEDVNVCWWDPASQALLVQ